MTPRPEATTLAQSLMRDGRLAVGSNPHQQAEMDACAADEAESALRAAELAMAERCREVIGEWVVGERIDRIIAELKARP